MDAANCVMAKRRPRPAEPARAPNGAPTAVKGDHIKRQNNRNDRHRRPIIEASAVAGNPVTAPSTVTGTEARSNRSGIENNTDQGFDGGCPPGST
jgi:hypothetical protein